MARKRKRDWPQTVFRYAITDAEIPQAMWDQAKLMQTLWNRLAEMHEAIRKTITDETPEVDRKARWEQFNADALATCKAVGLKQECDMDVLDRFTKSCVAAARDPMRGWPRPRGLSVSIKHRYAGGGSPVSTLHSHRATRCRFDAPLTFHDGRRSIAGVFGLNCGDQIGFTAMVHRPIPSSAIVKSARWVGRRSVAFGWKWWLLIQVEVPPDDEPRQETGKACAIDVGWRKRGDALRVGYLVDSDGASREMLLSLDFSTRDSRRQKQRHPEWEQIPETHKELRELSERRDRRLEELKTELRGMLSPLPAGLDKMRGRGLVRLLHELPDVESAVKQRIQEWLDWDRPRFRTEMRARERFAAARQSIYEQWAADLATRYETIIVESISVKQMIEGDDREPALKAANRNHQIAATSELVTAIANACRTRGAKLVKKDAKHTTTKCHLCGGAIESGPALVLTCANGHSVDQDENAARNLLSQTTPIAEQKVRLRRKPSGQEAEVVAAADDAEK